MGRRGRRTTIRKSGNLSTGLLHIPSARHAGGGPMLRSIAFAFLFVLVLATSAFAETLRGRVVDADKRAVAQARVLVTRGTVTVTTVSTGSDGAFGPVTLPAGDYEVTVAAP